MERHCQEGRAGGGWLQSSRMKKPLPKQFLCVPWGMYQGIFLLVSCEFLIVSEALCISGIWTNSESPLPEV